jgi:type II secretory pathway component PulC
VRDKLKSPFKELYEHLKKRVGSRSKRAASSGGTGSGKWNAWRSALRKKFPENFGRFQLDLRKADPESVFRYLTWAKRGLIVLGLFFLAGVAARLIGSFIKPVVLPPSNRITGPVGRPAPKEDYDEILRRNMFNVEGTIPDPFDQGQLDCFSQARATSAPIQLLGTIVMSDDKYSVALVQEEGSPLKVGVKKDESFGQDKYQAMKIERNKLCFQVRSTQEFEYVEIPGGGNDLSMHGPSLTSGAPTDGITPVSENQFVVNQAFLEKNLLNLNEILQTARATPYVDPSSGKFRGFLIQSIDPNSPFRKLGVNQGDVLTAVNDIVLDNAGKGLEAFQKLRNSPKVSLQVLRGGQPYSMSYDIKP